MKISDLIKKLNQVVETQGDIEVTCTGSTLRDDHGGPIPDVFESTVENVTVISDSKMGRRVRLYM